MLYTLAAAAKASGLGASAIRAAIERGQIAAIKDLFDEWQVEDTELYRLYFPVGHAAAKPNESLSSSSSGGSNESQTGARLEDSALRNGNEDASACASKADHGRELLCPSPAENEVTGPQGGPPALRDCLAAFGEPSRKNQHGYSGARFGFSGLAHTDDTSAGHTLFWNSDISWDSDIKIDARPETLEARMRPSADRRRAIVFTGALLTAFVIGWIGGLGWYHFFGRSLLSVAQESHSYSPTPPESQIAAVDKRRRELAVGDAVTGKIPAAAVTESRTRRARLPSPGMAQSPEARPTRAALTARQNSTEATPDISGEWSPAGMSQATNASPRRIPVPETKPITVEGWTVRGVYNGTVVLEGPGGVWTASRGDTVPGLGRVDSIVMWGNRWIVATTRGLVSTP